MFNRLRSHLIVRITDKPVDDRLREDIVWLRQIRNWVTLNKGRKFTRGYLPSGSSSLAIPISAAPDPEASAQTSRLPMRTTGACSRLH